MPEGPEINVHPNEDGSFTVEVSAGGAKTAHTVTIPAGLADGLGWTESDPVDLVRASFVFLLEREPATSILRRFRLDQIAGYFPEYPVEMARRRST